LTSPTSMVRKAVLINFRSEGLSAASVCFAGGGTMEETALISEVASRSGFERRFSQAKSSKVKMKNTHVFIRNILF